MNEQLDNGEATVDAPPLVGHPATQTRPSAADGTLPTQSPAQIAGGDPSTHEVAWDGGPGTANDATAELIEPRPARFDPAGTAAFEPVQAMEDADSAGSDRADTEPIDERDRASKPAPLPLVTGYDVLAVMGRGSMGVVYKARQRGLKRFVALKMILAGDHAAQRDLARFRSEAEAVAQLQHPNIVQIYEVGEQDGRPFFSLEYVDGESLARKVAGTPLPPRTAGEIVGTLARAMQYAHERGVIHRDLKPSNVLLTQSGLPKISDFGLAKRLDDDSSQTRDGSILGTPSYMPPEQAEGRAGDVGPLSDVYSLGAILYDLLTGRAPFRSATMLETLDLVRSQEPVAPSQLQPGTPPDLETICLKCLQKDPHKRYASAADLAADLSRYLSGEPIRARPVSAGERAWRWCRRNPVVASLTAAVALLLVTALAGSVAFSAQIYREKQATDRAIVLAENNSQLAEKNMVQALANAETARTNAERAEKNADAALKRQYAAMSHVIKLSQQVHQKLRPRAANAAIEGELRPLRDELLKAMRAHSLALAKEMEGTGLTSFSTVYAHQAMGDLFRDLGLGTEALEQYEQAHALAKKAAEAQPDEDRGRGNWALVLARLGDMEIELRADLPRATTLYREALDLQEGVEARPRNNFYKPVENKRLKANYLFKLGEASRLAGDPAAARMFCEKSAALRREWAKQDAKSLPALGYLAEATLWSADACGRQGDIPAMHAGFKDGIALVEQILARKAHHDFKADLAESFLMYGDACMRLDLVDDARQHYEKCPPLVAAAVNKEPENLRYLGLYARMRYAQGLTAVKADVAAARFTDALTWREKLLAIDAESLPQQMALTTYLARNGQPVDAAAKADALRKRVAKNPDLLVQLAGSYALCARAAAEKNDKERYTGQALSILGEVMAAGYQDHAYLRTHPDLSPLVANPAFQELVAIRK